jgi:UMF1 family MFS transporter
MDQKKEIFSWAFYDWANSGFATTVMAAFFPIFFKAYWADPGNPALSTFWLGTANSIASLIVAAFAPFLGAIADRTAGKKRFLIIFAFLGIVMTGALYLLAAGAWIAAVLFYVFATVGFEAGNIFYDGLLPGVASEQKVDYVSSLGYGLGYIGGGLLFLVNVVMYLMPDLFGIPDSVMAVKIAFVTVAIWWAGFSIPIMVFVKEPEVPDAVGIKDAVRAGWLQLKTTFKDLKNLRIVALFLVGYWFYIDGVDTIIRMAIDYGVTLGFSDSSLIIALLITQFVAFPAAILYYKLAFKIGPKRSIMVAIGGYIVITILGYFMTQELHFYLLAVMVALFQGGIQAISRSLFTRIIPAQKSAQFFGFYNMLGKFAAILGPFLMGTVTLVTGNIRYGILSLIVLFLIGGFCLWKTDIAKGEEIAKTYL